MLYVFITVSNPNSCTDEKWGRYKTICVALAIVLIGHVFLIIATIPPVLTSGSTSPLAIFVIGVIILGVGTGGFKPNISPVMLVPCLRVTHVTVC